MTVTQFTFNFKTFYICKTRRTSREFLSRNILPVLIFFLVPDVPDRFSQCSSILSHRNLDSACCRHLMKWKIKLWDKTRKLLICYHKARHHNGMPYDSYTSSSHAHCSKNKSATTFRLLKQKTKRWNGEVSSSRDSKRQKEWKRVVVERRKWERKENLFFSVLKFHLINPIFVESYPATRSASCHAMLNFKLFC